LAYFHTITPNFPTQAPCSKRWAFPIIFNKPYVVQLTINTNSSPMILSRDFGNQADWVSLALGIDSSAVNDLDYLHNDHQLAF
jgi:hypothetical protein